MPIFPCFEAALRRHMSTFPCCKAALDCYSGTFPCCKATREGRMPTFLCCEATRRHYRGTFSMVQSHLGTLQGRFASVRNRHIGIACTEERNQVIVFPTPCRISKQNRYNDLAPIQIAFGAVEVFCASSSQHLAG